MTHEFDYDLFVIGAGSGGVRAARIASQHGAKTAIAEEFRYGGTCVIRGCVPKKLFVYASHFHESFEDAAGYGWTVGESQFDWKTLVANKDKEISRLENIYKSNLERVGVEVVKTRALIEGPHTIRLCADDRTVTAKTILVATGGHPNIDTQMPGHEHLITSNEVFHLEEFPSSIVIVGGGYIAVEFACIFAGLGAETTLVYRGEQILRGFDDEVRNHLRTEIEKKGVNVVTQDVLSSVAKEDDGTLTVKTKAGQTFKVDQVLTAIGRSPNTSALGLETAGVATGAKGQIIVDEMSRTNIPSIYAVGDVTDRVNLTPVAIREGHAFADTVFGGKSVSVDHELIATAVFSQPEIGTVGYSEAEALERFGALDIYTSSFRPMKHTLSGRDEKMFMKLIVAQSDQKVVGCHIVGPDSGEMAQLAGIALKMGATKADFDATVAVHPTASEELVTMRSPTRSVAP